jgi:glutamate synthase domain-containing protein 1
MYRRTKEISGCSLSGMMNEDGERMSGEDIIRSIAVMHDRGNGLGGGFAGYGIYPDYEDRYALHLIFDHKSGKEQTEKFLDEKFYIEAEEEIPHRDVESIVDRPILWRYFCKPRTNGLKEDDFIVDAVMEINTTIDSAFVMSSGKNMGVFKAIGFPEEVGEFYRLKEYEAYTWIAHGRFPTNTPGWWGGAHPFSILDWSVVHNGEISSYGINKRYLEMFGYKCTLLTDTEVMAYLFDLLMRRHGMPIDLVAMTLAAPFWETIDRMPEEKRVLAQNIRMIYGSALVNGPFAVIVGYKEGMIGLNDRTKLRPLIAARKKEMLYISSEEAGIREVSPSPDEVWAPRAGEPIAGRMKSC